MPARVVKRSLNIDSMFRSSVLVTPSTDMQLKLPTTITNVVQMAVSQVEVPPTYYNVSRHLGNRTFVVNDGTTKPKVVQLPEGLYQITYNQDEGQATKTAADIELAINNAMKNAGVHASIAFTVDKATHRGVFATRNGVAGAPTELTFFFDVDEEGNMDGGVAAGGLRTKLGWMLGFRSGVYKLKHTTAVAVAAEAAAYVPNNRYMYLVVDDYCNEAYEAFTSVFHESLNTKNVLARIDLGDTVDHTKWTTTPRAYKGPVNLTKMRVTLTDELGRVVDLNGVDWSVVLTLDCVVDR
jgi:hypothetical protein